MGTIRIGVETRIRHWQRKRGGKKDKDRRKIKEIIRLLARCLPFRSDNQNRGRIRHWQRERDRDREPERKTKRDSEKDKLPDC